MGYFDVMRDVNQYLEMLEEKYGSGVSHCRKQQLHGWRAERELARCRQAEGEEGRSLSVLNRGIAIAAWFSSLIQILAKYQPQSR